MPLYEYRCAECGTLFERLKPMSAADQSDPCPVCRSTKTERRFSAFATARGTETTVSAGSGGCGPSGRFT